MSLDEIAEVEQAAAQTSSQIRPGYACAALGKHTIRLRRGWVAARPTTSLVLVHSGPGYLSRSVCVESETWAVTWPTASATSPVLRRPLQERRF